LPWHGSCGYCTVQSMKARWFFLPVLLIPLFAGCQAVPMSYAQWQKETSDRLAFKRAGLEYKSPEQLRAEAADMRDLADSIKFERK
jgi:hypothetical protein